MVVLARQRRSLFAILAGRAPVALQAGRHWGCRSSLLSVSLGQVTEQRHKVWLVNLAGWMRVAGRPPQSWCSPSQPPVGRGSSALGKHTATHPTHARIPIAVGKRFYILCVLSSELLLKSGISRPFYETSGEHEPTCFLLLHAYQRSG